MVGRMVTILFPNEMLPTIDANGDGNAPPVGGVGLVVGEDGSPLTNINVKSISIFNNWEDL